MYNDINDDYVPQTTYYGLGGSGGGGCSTTLTTYDYLKITSDIIVHIRGFPPYKLCT